MLTLADLENDSQDEHHVESPPMTPSNPTVSTQVATLLSVTSQGITNEGAQGDHGVNGRMISNDVHLSPTGVRTSPPLPTSSRASPLQVTCPVTTAQPSHSHSLSSQQDGDSFSHGDLAHAPSPPRSEAADVETSGPLPQSMTVASCTRRNPLVFKLSLPRTRSESVAHLRDAVGTSIVTPPSGASRGLDRSPIRVNTKPALKMGHTAGTCSTSVSIGNLSDPGVTLDPLPVVVESVAFSQATDSTAQFTSSPLSTTTTTISITASTPTPPIIPTSILSTSLPTSSISPTIFTTTPIHLPLFGTTYTPSPSPPTITQPPSTPFPSLTLLQNQVNDLSVSNKTLTDNVQSLTSTIQTLVASNQSLTETIQSLSTTVHSLLTSNQTLLLSYQNLTQTFTSILSNLTSLKRDVGDLQSTCKSFAEGRKRKHDDQDDPDHHKGEKRPRLSNQSHNIFPFSSPSH